MGSGFESQGAHFKENPADSSESAGFLRSLVNAVLKGYRYFPLLLMRVLGRRYSPSFLQGTRPRFASDTLMSLRAIPSFLAWLPSAAVGDICTSARIGIRGALRFPPGSVGVLRGFRVRPVPSELGRGRAVAVWRVAWWLGVWAGAPCFPEAPSGCHTDALRSEARRDGASG